MKIDNQAKEQIINWLNSNRDYTEGVVLYSIYGKNNAIKKLLPGRQHRYADKLAYELGKLAGFLPGKLPSEMMLAHPNKASSLPENKIDDVTTKSTSPNILKDSIPKVIGALITSMQKAYKKRSILHKRLKTIPPDNRSDNVKEREKISKDMEKLSDQMDHLAEMKNEYELNGTLPDPNDIFDKPKDNSPPKIDFDLARKQRLNLQKSIALDKLLLNYQGKKKLLKLNPMPKCPKRTNIENRIAKKLEKLHSLDRILKHDPS